MQFNFTKSYALLLAALLLSTKVDAQKFEAENATLANGAEKVSCAGCSGGFAVEQKEGNLSFDIDLTEAGFYSFTIRAAALGGEKTNTLRIDDQATSFFLKANSQYKNLKIVSALKLTAGNHTVEIIKSWGWINIDYLKLEKVSAGERFDLNQLLVTPDPIPEATALYGFLLDHYGKRIISGVMTLNSFDESGWLKERTGKEPALLGIDFMHSGRGYAWYEDETPINDASAWYARNGIPALMWHWRDPSRETEEFYVKNEGKPEGTTFDITQILDENSAGYKAMLADIDYISGLLKQLQEDNIPVLWRPLHEAAGGWFWWGAKGPEPLKKLWQLMFDRMVNYHGLHNLIWVWTSEPGDEEWYPGDAYVDIVGKDIYDQGNHGAHVITFGNLNDQLEGKKMITLSEVGSFPDPDNLMNEGVSWSWFMPWYGGHTREEAHNPLSLWEKTLNHPYVITLDEMPDLRTYERHEVEPVEEPGPEPMPTGINDKTTGKRSFMAYPTLVGRELTLKSDYQIETVAVFNAIGRCIKQEEAWGNNAVVSFKGLLPGLYFVKVNGGETVRVLKQ